MKLLSAVSIAAILSCLQTACSEQPKLDLLTTQSTESLSSIDRSLFDSSINFIYSSQTHHALFNLNKKMYLEKQQSLSLVIDEILSNCRLHRVLAEAFLLPRKEWIHKREREIAASKQLALVTRREDTIITSGKTINETRALLAALIDQARRISLIAPTSRSKAIYTYLRSEYALEAQQMRAVLTDSGQLLAIDTGLSQGALVFSFNDLPAIVSYDETDIAHNGNLSKSWGNLYLGTLEPFRFIYARHNTSDAKIDDMIASAGVYRLQDILCNNSYFILLKNRNKNRSCICQCIYLDEIPQALIYWLTRLNSHQDSPASLIGTGITFDGCATTLAFDDTTQTIQAFDEHGKLLFSHKVALLLKDGQKEPEDEKHLYDDQAWAPSYDPVSEKDIEALTAWAHRLNNNSRKE